MFTVVKSAPVRVRLWPLKNLAELILQKPYSCVCAKSNFKGSYLLSSQQKAQGPFSQDVNYLVQRNIKPFSSKIEDKILVYHGSLTPQIRMVKIFSLCSSIAGLAAQPILYNHASELGTGLTVGVATFVGFFTFVTPFLLHILTRKYVTDLHYDDSTEVYTASLLTFFLRIKKVSFKSDDVIVPDVPGLFTSFIAKDTALFVDPRQFEDPTFYGKLMGYDKPMDFNLKKESLKDTDKISRAENSK